MRGLRVCVGAGVVAVAMIATGCGVAAPRHVGSVDGVGVTMEQVDDVARDPLFQLVGKDAEDFSLPGDAARQALMFKLSQAAWVAEAKRWGLDIEPARAAAEKDLDEQIASSSEEIKLSPELKRGYIDSAAAKSVLDERFSKLDPSSETDQRKVYELSPDLWDRTCAWILIVPAGSEKKIQKLADAGRDFTDIAKRVEGAEVATQPDDGCLSRTSIPVELRDQIGVLPLNRAKILEMEFNGAREQYLIKVVSRQKLTFDEARGDLAQIVSALVQGGAQAWISTRLAAASVDARFGSAITINGQGQPSLVPPRGPLNKVVAGPTGDESDDLSQ